MTLEELKKLIALLKKQGKKVIIVKSAKAAIKAKMMTTSRHAMPRIRKGNKKKTKTKKKSR